MRLLVAAAAAAGVAASAKAQQVRAVPPIGAIAPAPGPGNLPVEDPGVPVEMLENPHLDRYLRRARQFLDAENYVAAIQVLQDVIDGRTSEVVAGPGDEPSPPAAPPQPPPPTTGAGAKRVKASGTPPDRPGSQPAPKPMPLDARNSVFSHDGRLYRPVRRLCHELLAGMPAVGIEIYRTTHEAAATELEQAARAGGSIAALEEVANRYFVTLPAGRALSLLGDRLMHEGRYRAAVQVLTDLLEVYPADNRRRLGITDAWCRFKIAVCLRLCGEEHAAHAAAAAIAKAHGDESLRIAGELQAMADLPASTLFAGGAVAVAPAPAVRGPSWLAADTEELVPLWQYRFRNPEPYREPKSSARSQRHIQIIGDGNAAVTMPFAGRYGPATWVAFEDGVPSRGMPHAWFLEHFRLRTADAASGLLLAQGDGPEEPPVPQENQLRVRVAASDYALLRPVDDGQRVYAVMGAKRASSSLETLKASELVAHERDGLRQAWSSQQWLDGDAGLRDVTFLAAPAVFGEQLLLPALRRTDYTLECLDRRSGRPLWHTLLHRGGTNLLKAPGCPVLVHGSTALVATNAGCIAAVDAFAGDLRWIRRYERVDPLRKRNKARRPVNQDMFYSGQFSQEELPGFHPNDLHVVRDGVVVAACDTEMLLCLDVATGQPRWMLDATTRHAPYGRLRQLVGTIGDDLYALSDSHVVAIGGAGGLVQWAHELPAWNGPQQAGRGRGAVVGDHIVVPGGRELFVLPPDGAAMRRIPLPTFDASREPLAGSCNVVARGPWLAIGYQGGVEVFSSRPALQQLAAQTEDTLQKCTLLVHAGDLDAAIEHALAAVRSGSGEQRHREALAQELLALVSERAHRAARDGDLARALGMLDAIGGMVTERAVRLDWHLARVELCKEAGDLRAHEREQTRLYDYMEGKG